MKKNLVITFAAVAAMATLFSCQKEQNEPSKVKESAIMTVNADVINTKTFIEESGSDYTTSWSLGDQIAAFEVGNGVIADEKTVSSALTADSADASFTMDFSGNTTLSPDYSYIFVYPAVRYSVNDGKTKYRVLIPDEQTFSSTTFDKNADILISEPVSGQASRPTSVHVGFERIGATVLMNLKAPTTSETITSIVFSTTQDNIQGYVEITPASDTYTKTIYSGGKSITLTPASATTYTGTIPVWFRCAAIDLNTDFTVVVNTNARSYKKTVNLATSASKEIKFENAGMTKFNVDMTSVDPFVSFDVGTVITSIFPTVNKGIKFTGSNTTYYRPYRVNKNNAITIDGGTATIKMIEFKFASGKEGDWSGDTGTVTDGIWTGSANTVVLTNTGNQSQFYDISVTYSGTGSNDVVVSTATSSLAATVPSIGVGNTTATTLTTNSPGAVTYSSNHPEYATVDPSTGVVTGVAAGTATITASIAAVDNGYIKVNASSATVDVTVTSDNVYTMTVRSSKNGAGNVRWEQSSTSLTYDAITWTPSVTYSGEAYWGGSGTTVQIGSAAKPATAVSLTTTGFAGKKIVSASLTGYCTSTTGPTISITAGSTEILSSTALVQTTSTEYTSTNLTPVTLTSGQAVTFNISSSAAAGIVISQIKVVYQD